MPDRSTPYGAFNFLVTFDGDENTLGGFSDVSGLVTEMKVSEYRNGNAPENHVQKVPGTHSVSDVTLKRGIISSLPLFVWIDSVRRTGPAAKKTVVVTLLDESAAPIQSWVLRGAVPLKYTGPTLAGKGGGDVAMEEIVLSCEALEIVAD